ncbi:MAG: glycosyltransferase [Sulfolobales archaeon]
MKSSPRVIIRRLLGRRGVFTLRNMISSIAFYTGLRDDPRKKPQGISAMVAVYNEEDWIEPSLLSIKDLVDEYIVMDSSNDNTPNIIMRLKNELGLNIRYHRVPQGSMTEIRNAIISKASYRWILVWDGDFVMREDSTSFIKNLIENLDPRRHYLIYWPWLLLCGDIYHLCSENPYHIEHWLYTYSEKLRYKDVYVNGFLTDTLVAPLRLYKAIYIDKILGVHLALVKNPVRIAIRDLWQKYRSEFYEVARKGVSFEEYASVKAREIYGTGDLKEVGCRIIRDMIERLPRYDESKYGELPNLVKRYWESSRNKWCTQP